MVREAGVLRLTDDMKYLFIADGQAGLVIVDIQNLYNPQIIFPSDIAIASGYAFGVTFTPDLRFAFTSDDNSKIINIYDISVIRQATLLSSV